MLLQEFYMICHFVFVVVSPHLAVVHPWVVVMVGVGLIVGLSVIAALFACMLARQFDRTLVFNQRADISQPRTSSN